MNSLMLLQRNKSYNFLGVSALKYAFRLKSCLFLALTAFNSLHSKPSTWNMWNNHHSQRAISGISNLKRFPICISADAINKRKTRQIFILIKDDEKDLFFLNLKGQISGKGDKSLTQNASWTSKQSLSSLCFLQP